MPKFLRDSDWTTKLLLAASVVTAAAVPWFIYIAEAAAADAKARYGHNVDSGALFYAAAVFYLAPGSLLCLLAGITRYMQWRGKTVLSVCAIGFLSYPFVGAAAGVLLESVGK